MTHGRTANEVASRNLTVAGLEERVADLEERLERTERYRAASEAGRLRAEEENAALHERINALATARDAAGERLSRAMTTDEERSVIISDVHLCRPHGLPTRMSLVIERMLAAHTAIADEIAVACGDNPQAACDLVRRGKELDLTDEQIEHVALYAAEHMRPDLEALCDGTDPGKVERIIDAIERDNELAWWMGRGRATGWQMRTKCVARPA